MKLSVEEMLEKFSNNSTHPQEVRKIALMIFDEVAAKLCEFTDRNRRVLEAAALLHDIGYYVDTKHHNKHSQEMVLQHGLKGFDGRETSIVACLCRFHRGSLPDKEKHELYGCFEKKDRKLIRRLGGILKLADGLDRAHLSLIKKIKINIDEDNNIVEFILTPNTPDYYPDISSAIRKRDLFEVGFKMQTVLKFSHV